MGSIDFLRQGAPTPLCERYLAAGMLWEVSTNCPAILESSRELFGEPTRADSAVDLRLRLWADEQFRSAPPWPKPYFRGLGPLIFAGFDSANSLLVDLRNGTATGRFAESMACDRGYWRTIIFPMLSSVVAAASNVTELHCGCVTRAGHAVLLAGPSGSGKSTLSLALACRGFDFVSDDRTYISARDGRLMVWPLSRTVKLRPDALAYFPGLSDPESRFPGFRENVFELHHEQPFLVSHGPSAPDWILFLERREASCCELTAISEEEAAIRLESGLLQENPTAAEVQRQTIRRLVEQRCRIFRYGGDPHRVAATLADALERGGPYDHRSPTAVRGRSELVPEPRVDPLRRFTATPFATDLPVMDRMIRLETNSATVINIARRIFDRYRPAYAGRPHFIWRVVAEADTPSEPLWLRIGGFSRNGLRYLNLGPRSFLAVDVESRQAVGYLPEKLASDEIKFTTVFLGDLFYLTAGALGLTSVVAACVALGDKGILLLGPPNSGKTTSSYLAEKAGFEFHTDRASFIELVDGRLRAWGDFWPAAFRPETTRFLPELIGVTQRLDHYDFAFLCRNQPAPARAHAVKPVSCIFLERGVATPPRLVPLNAPALADLLRQSVPFHEGNGFDANRDGREGVLRALAELPAYRLLYGDDPASTTQFIRSLLLESSGEVLTGAG
jgi:hypothetical protein